MPAKPFEASVRQQPGTTIIDLNGEINAFAEEALNAAYLVAGLIIIIVPLFISI